MHGAIAERYRDFAAFARDDSPCFEAWALAVAEKLNIRALAELAAPHPSYAEMAKYAGLAYFSRSLTSAWVRRIIGWLRR